MRQSRPGRQAAAAVEGGRQPLRRRQRNVALLPSLFQAHRKAQVRARHSSAPRPSGCWLSSSLIVLLRRAAIVVGSADHRRRPGVFSTLLPPPRDWCAHAAYPNAFESSIRVRRNSTTVQGARCKSHRRRTGAAQLAPMCAVVRFSCALPCALHCLFTARIKITGREDVRECRDELGTRVAWVSRGWSRERACRLVAALQRVHQLAGSTGGEGATNHRRG